MEASEAAETTETTEEQAPPSTEQAIEGTETTETEEQAEAPAPQLGDTLKSMQSSIDGLARKIDGEPEPPNDFLEALTQPEEEEGEYYEGEGQVQQQPSEDDQLESQLRELIREEATQLVSPYFQQQEAQRRADAIRAFADEHPRLKEPEVMQAVSGRLRELAHRNQNPALQTDPALVELAYKAYEADAAAAAQTPAEAAGQGATLEAGAGPSAPTPEVDPVHEEYGKAFAGGTAGDRPDPLTS